MKREEREKRHGSHESELRRRADSRFVTVARTTESAAKVISSDSGTRPIQSYPFRLFRKLFEIFAKVTNQADFLVFFADRHPQRTANSIRLASVVLSLDGGGTPTSRSYFDVASNYLSVAPNCPNCRRNGSLTRLGRGLVLGCSSLYQMSKPTKTVD